MYIYLASSWRNEQQASMVAFLRENGHEVYDFKNPAPGDTGFSWRQCAPSPEALKDPRAFRDTVLTSEAAEAGFRKDMTALRECDACVLLLPCGRSAHLELGWACGAKKPAAVLLDNPMSEPELMYKMLSPSPPCQSSEGAPTICVDRADVIAFLESVRLRQEAPLRSSSTPRFRVGDVVDLKALDDSPFGGHVMTIAEVSPNHAGEHMHRYWGRDRSGEAHGAYEHQIAEMLPARSKP